MHPNVKQACLWSSVDHHRKLIKWLLSMSPGSVTFISVSMLVCNNKSLYKAGLWCLKGPLLSGNHFVAFLLYWGWYLNERFCPEGGFKQTLPFQKAFKMQELVVFVLHFTLHLLFYIKFYLIKTINILYSTLFIYLLSVD